MRAQACPTVLAIALGITLAACEGESTKSVETALGPSLPDPATAQATGGPLYHFVSKGAYADLFMSEGTLSAYLSVSKGGPPNQPQTFLYYTIYRCDEYTCAELEAGWGLIPNGDVKGGGNRLELNTNTASNPEFYRYAGSGGPITVTWEKTAGFSYGFNSNNRYQFANFAYRAHATGSGASATPAGSIVGVSIGGSYLSGFLGRAHSGELAIERGSE